MKAFITKWALTDGIRLMEAARTIDPTRMEIADGSYRGANVYKPHWHITWEEAHARAETMRKRKIVGLKQQVAKLETMTFKPPLWKPNKEIQNDRIEDH